MIKEAMNDGTCRILFLCTGNSARSILAEAILNRLGGGQIVAFSAGSHPRGEVHPNAMDVLRQHGHHTGSLRSKSWNEFAAAGAPDIDIVVTVCDSAAAEVCPVWPGRPVSAHWSLPDPAAADGTEDQIRIAFSDTYQQLLNRISKLLEGPLDRQTLKERLRALDEAAEQ
jgi:protein-tyrosine-phosphatase